MKYTLTRTLATAGAVALSLAMLSGCENMTRTQKNSAIGAAVGGVAGSVLTGGSTGGVLGGAAIGGIIGNQTGK
ncbi:glycine zipper 2TM domain-containing protein [Amphibiibacter pelophylacis]|uniref:Glycine zipper 2TM domain-containing protein n=1 Tax=Amphibiibacter pelophylacis TaxID=1799477 RepID=A0ACC6P4H7_9BURK